MSSTHSVRGERERRLIWKCGRTIFVLQSSSDDDVYQTHDQKSVVSIPHTHRRHFISCRVFGDALRERLQDILKSKMPADIGISLFKILMLVFVFLMIPPDIMGKKKIIKHLSMPWCNARGCVHFQNQAPLNSTFHRPLFQ